MEKLPFLTFFRRDPTSAILTIFGILVVGFVAFGLFGGLERYDVPTPAKPDTSLPAGVAAARLSKDGIELFGWGPKETSVNIKSENGAVKTATVSDVEKWQVVIPLDKQPANLQSLTLETADKNKSASPFGKVRLFVPGRKNGVYVWWNNDDTIQLLNTPKSNDDATLLLALAVMREGKPLQFLGQASDGNVVQLYANDELVGSAKADSNGYWNLSSLLKDKKARLRFDEIDLAAKAVVDRKEYKLDWPDGGKTGVLRTWNDSWVIGEQRGDKTTLIYVLKPEVGKDISIDLDIPGQMMPTGTPQHTIDAYR